MFGRIAFDWNLLFMFSKELSRSLPRNLHRLLWICVKIGICIIRYYGLTFRLCLWELLAENTSTKSHLNKSYWNLFRWFTLSDELCSWIRINLTDNLAKNCSIRRGIIVGQHKLATIVWLFTLQVHSFCNLPSHVRIVELLRKVLLHPCLLSDVEKWIPGHLSGFILSQRQRRVNHGTG